MGIFGLDGILAYGNNSVNVSIIQKLENKQVSLCVVRNDFK